MSRDRAPVAHEGEVEGHVAFQAEPEPAALQFERPNGAVFGEQRARASVYVQKRQGTTAREGIEVTAGMGDPVHFVERIRKERDARSGVHRPASCGSASARRRAVRTCRLLTARKPFRYHLTGHGSLPCQIKERGRTTPSSCR